MSISILSMYTETSCFQALFIEIYLKNITYYVYMSNVVTLSEKFIKGLKLHNLDYDTIVREKWYYAGGDTGRHARYYDKCCPDKNIPPHANKCVCGHFIKQNCYITNGEHILVLGNCCIRKFIKKSFRTCKVCSKKHKNRKDNLCHNCRRDKNISRCERCNAPHNNRKYDVCNDCGKCNHNKYYIDCEWCDNPYEWVKHIANSGNNYYRLKKCCGYDVSYGFGNTKKLWIKINGKFQKTLFNSENHSKIRHKIEKVCKKKLQVGDIKS